LTCFSDVWLVFYAPPSNVGKDVMFSGCPSIHSFIQTDIVTMISRDRLEQS